ncbi:MAG: creatininase family protein [Mycobacteriaceae bacterium]
MTADLLPTATSPEVGAAGARVAVLPVGSFEQHGPHLPLTTDTLIACLIAREIAVTYDLFLLSPITISCSHEHAAFVGTVSIKASTLISVIDDIARSLDQSGIHHLVIVNGHGGNYVLSNIVQQANVSRLRMTLFPGRDDWATTRELAGMETTVSEDMHAGELETSLLLAGHAGVVRPDYLEEDNFANPRPDLLTLGIGEYAPAGVVGRPSVATPQKGKKAVEVLIDRFGRYLDVLTHSPLRELA